MQKKWLQAVSWDSVLTVNKALCHAQKLEPLTRVKSLDAARRLWETAMPRSLSLKEMLDVCRECHELSPFTFNNGNTFAALGRTLLEEWTKSLPPVEAQIVQTTVGHYIAGLIGRRELLQVLKHFEKSWKPADVRLEPPALRATPAPTLGVPQLQA
jgi:hypothetical protein